MKYILLYAVRKLLRSLTWLYFQKYVKDYGDEAAEEWHYPRAARSIISYALVIEFMKWMKALFLDEAGVEAIYIIPDANFVSLGALTNVTDNSFVSVGSLTADTDVNVITVGSLTPIIDIES